MADEESQDRNGSLMTTPQTLPTLPGLSWSVHKKPKFSSLIASHASGREVRVGLYAHALYEFELSYEALDSGGAHVNLQAQSLQTLMGFFLSCGGQLSTFLYTDPTDNSATLQTIGTGDGSTTVFTLLRSIGGYAEPVSYVTAVSSVTVNGVSTSSYTLAAPNTIVFTTAPAASAIIRATFTYAFQCRFLEDQWDFENVTNGLWTQKSVKFISVR
jgi:uncharacterized protein (TIGR02217 family)